jgi:hypothetical protein
MDASVLRRLAAALVLAALAAAAGAAAGPPEPASWRLLPPGRMGGFLLRALWETRYATPVGDHAAGEVWRVEAAYDVGPWATPLDGAGRPLPEAAPAGCPARHDHGVAVTFTLTGGGDGARACGGGRRGGDAVPLLDACATLRRNVGDRAATEGSWALEWREAGVDFLLRLGPGAEALPDARERLLAAGAEARGWARRFTAGALPPLAELAPQRAAAEGALAAGRAEAAAPAACRAP